MHNELVDPILDIRRRIGNPEQTLVIGLVLAEQQLRRGVGAQHPLAQLRVRRTRRGDSRLSVGGRQRRLGDLVTPRPRVTEPQRRQQMQRRRVRAAIVRRDQHQDVIGTGLGVLHDHIEIAVLVEDPGVQQLVLHLLLTPAAVGRYQVQVRERPLRILVLALHIRMRRRAVQVEPILLDVLTMVALAIGQAEHPLLENRVGAIPQSKRKAQPLPLIADPREAVLTPPVSTRARLVVGEVVPRISTAAVVLAHRSPLALAQIRAPRLPRNRAGARLLQSLVLGGLGARRVRSHGSWPASPPTLRNSFRMQWIEAPR